MNYLIGITGGSGSGKSEVLKQIRERYTETEVALVSQDNYYLPREDQEEESTGYVNFDRMEALDMARFASDLQQLRAGKSVSIIPYNFNKAPLMKTVRLSPAPVLVTEGTFVLAHPQISEQLDLKLFLETDLETMFNRRLKRDQEERGYEADEIKFRFEEHFIPSFEKYVVPFKDHADLIIGNNGQFERVMDVITTLIERQLKT